VPHHRRYALVYLHHGAVWLYQRREDKMLGGLWGVPLAEKRPEGRTLTDVEHAYTHFTLTVTPVLVSQPPERGEPVPRDEVGRLALSTLDRKLLARLDEAEAPRAARAHSPRA
jgi:adenine-specific DNA glycosylase